MSYIMSFTFHHGGKKILHIGEVKLEWTEIYASKQIRQCHQWDGEGSYFIDVDDVIVRFI